MGGEKIVDDKEIKISWFVLNLDDLRVVSSGLDFLGYTKHNLIS